MVLCHFYVKGHCRNGDRCKFEHPPDARNRQSSFAQNNSWTNPAADKVVGFSIDSMLKDFDPKVDKPLWKFSSYGPGKCEPSLITELDESPEEFRVKAVAALKAGDANEYLKYEAEKSAASDAAYANARTHVAQAFEMAKEQSTQGTTISPTTSNSRPPAAPTSAFGQTSAFGPTTTNNSVFGGRTSGAFGSAPVGVTSTFGTSAPTTSSTFVNPSSVAPVFGKPAFGQPTFGQSGFGTTPATSTAGTSAFGQAAPLFGQATLPTSAFGDASGESAFGLATPSTLIKPATTGAFGNSGGSGGGAFGAFTGGQASAFGVPVAASAPASVFGGGNNQTNAFGTNLPASSSSFAGSPTSAAPTSSNSAFGSSGGNGTFGGNSAAGGAFGALANNTTQATFGGQPTAGGTAQTSIFSPQQPATSAFAAVQGSGTSVFGQPPSTEGAFSAFPSSNSTQSAFGAPGPAFSNASSIFAGGAGSTFGSNNSTTSVFGQAQPSTIPPNPAAGSGPPNFSSTRGNTGYKPGANKYDSLLPPNYLQLLPGPVKEAFEGEKFTWGKVPEWIPPLELR